MLALQRHGSQADRPVAAERRNQTCAAVRIAGLAYSVWRFRKDSETRHSELHTSSGVETELSGESQLLLSGARLTEGKSTEAPLVMGRPACRS